MGERGKERERERERKREREKGRERDGDSWERANKSNAYLSVIFNPPGDL